MDVDKCPHIAVACLITAVLTAIITLLIVGFVAVYA